MHGSMAAMRIVATATMQWARERIANQITVKDLARHNGVSPRTLARRFTDSTGTTPMAWLTHERLQLAQQLLERTDLPIAAVARQAGLGSPLTLRRHFERQLDMTPSTYRRAFRRTALPAPPRQPRQP